MEMVAAVQLVTSVLVVSLRFPLPDFEESLSRYRHCWASSEAQRARNRLVAGESDVMDSSVESVMMVVVVVAVAVDPIVEG